MNEDHTTQTLGNPANDSTSSLESELPRFELREAQCRRFEKLIGEAIKTPTLLLSMDNISEVIGGSGMNSRTFKLRFEDALLGFRRYHYPSEVIPIGYDLRLIKVVELAGNKVAIKNAAAASIMAAERSTGLHYSNKSKVIEAVMEFKYESKGEPRLDINFSDLLQVDEIVSLVKRLRPDIAEDDIVVSTKFKQVQLCRY